MMKYEPINLIDDNPEVESTLFGFESYGKSIAEVIASRSNKTPLGIGIYGHWGSGKTTLMRTVLRHLKSIDSYKNGNFRHCKPIWFQAWRYKDEDDILAILIEVIFRHMKQDGFFNDFKSRTKIFQRTLSDFKIWKAITIVLKVFIRVDISELFSKLKHREKLKFYYEYREYFSYILKLYLDWHKDIQKGKKLNIDETVLVVFIDDLDRCPKSKIIKILETIWMFMENEKCVFIIGAANDIIENALIEIFGEDANDFLDKIFQVTFRLPRVPAEDFKSFIKIISPEFQDSITPFLNLIASSVGFNPRRYKRFLNNLNLMFGFLRNKEIVEISLENLLMWNIIEYVYPSLSNDLKDNPSILFVIKETVSSLDISHKGQDKWEISQEILNTIPLSLQKYILDENLVNLIRNFDISHHDLRSVMTLGETIESAENIDAISIDSTNNVIDLDQMVQVDGCEYLFGHKKSVEAIDYPFLIDIYPVTNKQFSKFIEANGYVSKEFWSENGFKWKYANDIKAPEFWMDEAWNKQDHPVVGVSYYEAEAYANWSGKRLPTEHELELTSRGTDGRDYPWGNEFDREKCNTLEAGIGKTTRVYRYPNGISPFGCYDMTGNVWVWTKSLYDNKEDQKYVIRGGSWKDDRHKSYCFSREKAAPYERTTSLGFRCIRTNVL